MDHLPLIFSKDKKIRLYRNKEELIKHLLNTYGESLIRLAYSYLKDQSKAEDILQETMLTAFLQFDTIRDESALKSWLYRIAINKCKDYLKSWQYKHLKLNQFLSLKLSSHDRPIDLRLVIKDEKEELIQSIFQLPLKYREVILLYYYEELSLHEIETLLSIKQSTVKSRLHYARQLLKIALQTKEGI